MTNELKTVLNELRRCLGELYGPRLERMFLYGSQARGEAGPESDVDVMVVLKGSVSPGTEIAWTGDVVASLSLENDLVISCTFVSADRFRRERTPLLLNVHREGISL